MRNFSYRIACSTNSVSSRKTPEAFFGALISEINTTRKSDQYDIRVDWVDPVRLAQETEGRHQAHQLSGGDSPIIATDAGSAIAYANGCAGIIACYDFFEDIERHSQITSVSADQLRDRLYAALSHTERLVVVGDEARHMAWSYCPRDYHFVELPPLPLYRSGAGRNGGDPLIVLHDTSGAADADDISKLVRDRFGVADVVVADATLDSLKNVQEISIAIHVGRDRQSLPGMRLTDFWASGVPVVQYLSDRTGQVSKAGLVADNEDGFLAATLPELQSDIEVLVADPVLPGVFARNARAKVAGMRPLWLEIIQQALFGDEQ